MKIVFSSRAWEDYLAWQGDDRRGLDRVNGLIKECLREPFRGTGKPEPLSGNLSGWWSRRINREHRLVYRVSGKDDTQSLEIAQCRYHY
jgi:toxin YoeB